jgi:hypothetical protein
LVYAWTVQRVKDREQFDMMLDAPIPYARPRKPSTFSAVSREEEGENFMSFMTQHQARVGS